MTRDKATYITITSFDHIDVEALKQRLDIAMGIASDLRPGITKACPITPDQKSGVIEGLERQTTFYALPDGIEPGPNHNQLIVSTGADPGSKGRDHLTLVFKSHDSRLGLALSEPIAEDLSNAVAPSAPPEAIVSILRRWRTWADNFVLPFPSLKRDEMNAAFRRAQDTIFEVIRSAYPTYDEPQIIFEILTAQPFRQPQIWLQAIGSRSFARARPALTPEGRAFLASITPNMLEMTHSRQQGTLHFRVSAKKFGGDHMSANTSIIDRLKLIRSIDQPDLTKLVAKPPH